MPKSITVISLALNLFVLGAIVGGGLAGLKVVHPAQIELMSRQGPQFDGRRPSRADWLAQTAPERRREFRQLMMSELRGFRDMRDRLESSRRELIAVLSAPEFDPDAAREAIARVNSAEAEMRDAIQAAMIRVLENMTAEERAAAVEALKRPNGMRRFLQSGMQGGAPERIRRRRDIRSDPEN